MKRILSMLLLLGLFVPALQARQYVRRLDIKVLLDTTGTAHLTEVWDLSVDEGTEWYLVRRNLGDIEVQNLSVTDESGLQYVNEGSWDVDRDIAGKAGKCGLVGKSDGCEICWGLGSYGDHVYTVSYDMTNAVKSLHDYDCLHMQFVSPGMSANIADLTVTVSMSDGLPLSQDNARIWGFGFDGTIEFVGGSVIAKTEGTFTGENSVIELIRFDKGLFASTSIVDKDFDEVLQTAMEGSDYNQDEELTTADLVKFGMMALVVLALIILSAVLIDRSGKKKILGVPSTKDIDWQRTVPFGGNILEADYVLGKVQSSLTKKPNTFAAALILKMIQNGNLKVTKDDNGKIEISFDDSADRSGLSDAAKQLYAMMKDASGKDVILQDKEFSRWSKKHASKVSNWVSDAKTEAESMLLSDGSMAVSGRFSEKGQLNAREVIGFRRYIKDFTLVDERHSSEVILWQDLLVFGALYGMADKVAKELKDIKPEILQQQGGTILYDPYFVHDLVRMTNRLAGSITNAQEIQAQKASSGMGGHTSFGGGGGFYGGGFGGGAR